MIDSSYNGQILKIWLNEECAHYPQICRVLDVNDHRIELVGQDGVKDLLPLDRIYMVKRMHVDAQ